MVVVGDEVGPHQRAWLCAGYAWVADAGLAEPEVLAAEGERPLLLLPAAFEADPARLDRVFGWGLAEVALQRRGWAGYVAAVCWGIRTTAAAAAGLVVMLDRDRDGLHQFVAALLGAARHLA